MRYHDSNNWPLLREALKTMGRADLIGNGKQHLIPTFQPMVDGSYQSARKKNSTQGSAATTVSSRPTTQKGQTYAINKDGKAVALAPRRESLEPRDDVRFRTAQPKPGQMLSQHTGLPPRAGVAGGKSGSGGARKKR